MNRSFVLFPNHNVNSAAPAVLPPGGETAKPTTIKTTPKSVLPNFDPCEGGMCDKQSQRPNLETGAAVYVVFGLIGIDRSNISFNHVLTEKVCTDITSVNIIIYFPKKTLFYCNILKNSTN